MKFFPVVEASGSHAPVRRGHLIRWIVMRLSLIHVLIALTCMLVEAHSGFAQILDQRVSVGMDNEPLTVLFQRLERQTGVSFAFSMNDSKTVTFPTAERTVKETLDLALKNTVYTYEVIHNTITIFASIKSKVDEISETESNGYVSLFKITGRVIDAITQEPLPGVNVIVKGSTRGTSTNSEGEYSLGVESDETLIFTFIGYKSVTADVGNRSTIDVTLEQDVAQLNEVVVNGGYYETTDKLKTGSIVKIIAKDIEQQPVTSPLMALQGRVPGLEITPQSGAPGVAPKIRIRGTNSFRQSQFEVGGDGNLPLYIIDGVPVSSAPLLSQGPSGSSFSNLGFDPLSTININSIESIEILKDGDATAIYGSRGANGVILITTKRNSRSLERTNVEANLYSGLGRVSKRMSLLNLEQYVAMRKEALNNSGTVPTLNNAYDLLLWDTTRSTDWQKKLLGGTANITDVQTSVSSGTKNTSFRFNAGYHRETLIFPGDFGYRKLTTQLSVNHTSTDQRFRLSISSTFGLDNSLFFIGNMINSALNLPPNAPNPYNDDGTLNWAIGDLGGGTLLSSWDNPFAYLRNTQKVNTRNNISNINLTYEIIKGLAVSLNGGYTDVSNHEIIKQPRSSSPPTKIVSANATFTDNKRATWIAEPKVTFSKQIEKHALNMVVGSTLQNISTSGYIVGGDKYTSDALLGSLLGAGQITVFRDEVTDYRYNSLYARLGYRWNEKYLLNLTARRDGSSRFGPANRYGTFESIGAAWIFSSEDFIQKSIPFITFGKIRSSYGITGSDNIGDYNYYNLYDVTPYKYGGTPAIVPYSLYNPDYAWERTKKLEAAIELAFAQNRIGLEVNWYRNRSSNQLVGIPLSGVTGFSSVSDNFDATIENSGWEAMLRGDILSSNDWHWNVNLNISLPRNRLVKFDGIENSPYANIYKVGAPLSVKWVYTWAGVDQHTGLHNFVDVNGDGQFDDQDKSLQNLSGKVWYGGLSNTIQFKNLEFTFLLQFSNQRGPRYLPTSIPGSIKTNQPVDVLDRWQKDGDQTDIQRFYSSPGNSASTLAYERYALTLLNSNYNSTDAGFVRLKTLSLGYRLPNRWLEKTMIQDAKVFLQGQNLLTVTRYRGLDPETGSGLPPLLMITAGIQMKF